MITNAIIRKNELTSLLNVAEFAHSEVSAGKVMKHFKAVLGIVCKRRADFIVAVQQIIAQLKNELVEVEHDINAVEGAVVVEEVQVTRQPISVCVHWSESSIFKGEEVVYTFAEFERLAKCAAAANGNFKDNGYSKTKVTVCLIRSDTQCTETYGCRLDLAIGDTVSFQDHVQDMIRYNDTPEGAAYHNAVGLTEHVEYLRSVRFK